MLFQTTAALNDPDWVEPFLSLLSDDLFVAHPGRSGAEATSHSSPLYHTTWAPVAGERSEQTYLELEDAVYC